ncbi:MAG: hypothetical protein KAR43_11720, partial [Deltaproteobacteria bacterium]|nr:hypothetical protein [Deltaproteobacteria bacterium]
LWKCLSISSPEGWGYAFRLLGNKMNGVQRILLFLENVHILWFHGNNLNFQLLLYYLNLAIFNVSFGNNKQMRGL